MSEKQTPINHRIEDNGAGAAVLQKVLNTREVRQFLAAVLPGVLTVYAGKSRFRKVVSRMAGRHLSKNLHAAENALFERDLEALGVPCLRVEREYGPQSDVGRMRLRIGAFLERISAGGRGKGSGHGRMHGNGHGQSNGHGNGHGNGHAGRRRAEGE